MPNLEKKYIQLAILLLFISLTLTSCNDVKKSEPISETRLLLDTVCTITVYDTAQRPLLTRALDLCATYEAMFSRTVEGSDIWRINHAQGKPVEVRAQTVELIQVALDYSALSGGWFDITVGRLCALWDFNGNPAVPSPEELADARDTVDYRQVFIDGTAVHLGDAQAWLDLGGIAKGYIADQLADFLKEHGVKSAIIDLGGNIVTVGGKPGGELWHIGVNQPFSNRSEIIGSLSVGQASVVTSGIYERRFVENGTLYHHILDPKSGMPVDSDVVSVTIVSESSIAGDALSTIILLVGSEKALTLLDQTPGLTGAVLMLKSGELLQYGDIDFIAVKGEN